MLDEKRPKNRQVKICFERSIDFLMDEKDFKSITITEIVQSANLNRGTFYKHYQTQEELLNELIDDVLIDLIHSYREPYIKIKEFKVGKLSSSSIKIFDHVKRYSRFYTIIVNSNALPGFQNRICQVLKELVQKDLLASLPNLDIDPSLLSSYNAYALFGLIIEWVNGGFKFTPQQMVDQLIHILFYQTSRAETDSIFKLEKPF